MGTFMMVNCYDTILNLRSDGAGRCLRHLLLVYRTRGRRLVVICTINVNLVYEQSVRGKVARGPRVGLGRFRISKSLA